MCAGCESDFGDICPMCQVSRTKAANAQALRRVLSATVLGVVVALGFVFVQGFVKHVFSLPRWALPLAFYAGSGYVYGVRAAPNPYRGWIVTMQTWFSGEVLRLLVAIPLGMIVMPFALPADIAALCAKRPRQTTTLASDLAKRPR